MGYYDNLWVIMTDYGLLWVIMDFMIDYALLWGMIVYGLL